MVESFNRCYETVEGIENMRVLSIQEPYATLIMEQKKRVETRSWKTKYRGEIYIHASISKAHIKRITNPEILDWMKDAQLHFGYIICKAQLVDCIEMTEEYIEKVKSEEHLEYILGEYKVGRYAWVLENVEVLEQPIPAKGKLGIWTYEKVLER